jgi:hypothetical protein
VLAAGTVAASPLFLRAGGLFQPVVFDQLWWTVGFLALVRLGRAAGMDARGPAAPPAARTLDVAPRPARRRLPGATWWHTPEAPHWLLLGTAVGFGLLTKFSIVFFAAGALVGVVATPLRRALRTPGPWLAAGLALAIGAPSLVGQLRLGWPVAAQMDDLRASQLARVGPVEFLGGQLLLGPAVLLAVAGLVVLVAPPRPLTVLRAGRAAGIAALVAVGLLLVGHGKAYYAGPVYPLLWAAGAVAVGTRRWSAHPESARAHRWARMRLVAAALLVALYGAATLPFGLPLLPPEAMARYAATLGTGTETNTGGRLALPQDYADMLGWPELVGATAHAWQQIPADARPGAALLAGNYGQAGALALYGPRLGLPPVVSPAGSFWFFGPGERVGDPLLVVGVRAEELAPLCTTLRPMGVVRHERTRWLVDEERDVPITLCEGPRRTLHQLWPSLAGRN